jgi:predicted RNA-binding Zn-ribbon protein involved in translation (DUF1610 family)
MKPNKSFVHHEYCHFVNYFCPNCRERVSTVSTDDDCRTWHTDFKHDTCPKCNTSIEYEN